MGFPRTAFSHGSARPAILLPAILLALAASGPASALTGYRVSAALRSGQTAFAAKSTTSDTRARTCHKASSKTHSTDLARKFTPVACEQPPKSELSLPSTIRAASASALATIG